MDGGMDLWHDGDALAVNRTQIRVLEEMYQIILKDKTKYDQLGKAIGIEGEVRRRWLHACKRREVSIYEKIRITCL